MKIMHLKSYLVSILDYHIALYSIYIVGLIHLTPALTFESKYFIMEC